MELVLPLLYSFATETNLNKRKEVELALAQIGKY